VSEVEATIWIHFFTFTLGAIKLDVLILLVVSLVYFIGVTWAVLEERDED
jgi:hypothetical protein